MQKKFSRKIWLAIGLMFTVGHRSMGMEQASQALSGWEQVIKKVESGSLLPFKYLSALLQQDGIPGKSEDEWMEVLKNHGVNSQNLGSMTHSISTIRLVKIKGWSKKYKIVWDVNKELNVNGALMNWWKNAQSQFPELYKMQKEKSKQLYKEKKKKIVGGLGPVEQ